MTDPVARRNREWAHALTSGFASKVVAIVATLAQLPISASYLGREGFGLWATLVACFQLMAIADLGIGLGAQNRIADCFGRDNRGQILRIVKTAALLLLCIAAGLSLLLLLILYFTPVIEWLPDIVSAQGHDIRLGLTIVLGAILFNLPLSLGARYAIGLQQTWIVNVWLGLGAVLSLALIAIGAQAQVGFNTFLLLSIVGPVACSLASTVHIMARNGGIRLHWRARPDRNEVPTLLKAGCLFLLPQLCATAAQAGPPLVLTSVLGPAATASYVIATRLLNAVLQLQQMPIQPLWPAVTEAIARKDSRWIRRIMVMGAWYSVGCALVGGVAFFLLVDWIAGVWIGKNSPGIDRSLAAACAIWFAASCVTNLIATMLNSANHLRSQAIGNTLAVIVAFSLMPFFAAEMGTSGAMWALLVGFGLMGWPYMALDFWKRWRLWVS